MPVRPLSDGNVVTLPGQSAASSFSHCWLARVTRGGTESSCQQVAGRGHLVRAAAGVLVAALLQPLRQCAGVRRGQFGREVLAQPVRLAGRFRAARRASTTAAAMPL